MYLHNSELRNGLVSAVPRKERLGFKQGMTVSDEPESGIASAPGRPSATTRHLTAGRSLRRWPGGRWRGSRRQRAWRTWSATGHEEGQSRIGFWVFVLDRRDNRGQETKSTGTKSTPHGDTTTACAHERTAITAASIHCTHCYN